MQRKTGLFNATDGMEIWPQKINQNHENILAFGQHYQINLQKNGVEKKTENNVGSRIFAPLGPSKNGGLESLNMDFGGDIFDGNVFFRGEHSLGTPQLSTFGTPQHSTFEKTDFSG